VALFWFLFGSGRSVGRLGGWCVGGGVSIQGRVLSLLVVGRRGTAVDVRCVTVSRETRGVYGAAALSLIARRSGAHKCARAERDTQNGSDGGGGKTPNAMQGKLTEQSMFMPAISSIDPRRVTMAPSADSCREPSASVAVHTISMAMGIEATSTTTTNVSASLKFSRPKGACVCDCVLCVRVSVGCVLCVLEEGWGAGRAYIFGGVSVSERTSRKGGGRAGEKKARNKGRRRAKQKN